MLIFLKVQMAILGLGALSAIVLAGRGIYTDWTNPASMVWLFLSIVCIFCLDETLLCIQKRTVATQADDKRSHADDLFDGG